LRFLGTFSFLVSSIWVSMKARAINKPGRILATNSLGIETLTVAPYRIKAMLGGIILPKAPDEAVIPVAKEAGYFCAIIAGIMMAPIAATVAGAEPVKAPNMAQAITVT